jgi:hypothetical protein
MEPIASSTPSRGPRYTFTIPDKLRTEGDPKSITFVALTLEQELMGNKLLEKSGNVFDKVQLAIVGINGQPVDWGSGQTDVVLGKCSPKVRELILHGYSKIHTADKADSDSFLATMEVAV